MRESIIGWIKSYYIHSTKEGSFFDEEMYLNHILWWTVGLFLALILCSTIIWFFSKVILTQVIHAAVGKTKATWDDHLMHNKVFNGIAMIVPLTFMEYFMSIVFFNYPQVSKYTSKLIEVLVVLVAIIILRRALNGLRDILMEKTLYRDKPIASYTQVLKIIFTGILFIYMLSILSNKSPIFFLTSLGAISAVLLLIFKDTILGFVGSIQLSSNDMIRVGDWVTMDKYGADGDVEEINLTTVKVRNFDKTITTIPTYSFVADSFINWRGMEESDGRRIKRSVNIQLDSVKFATPKMLENLKKIELIGEFIEARQLEIESYNKEQGYEDNDFVNGRKQTNLGLFRRYIEFYLKSNPEINDKMTLMVRQLNPNQYGIPLELYCFTKTKEWSAYEVVMADIFDHIFAIINVFELSLFENPTGRDFKQLTKA